MQKDGMVEEEKKKEWFRKNLSMGPFNHTCRKKTEHSKQTIMQIKRVTKIRQIKVHLLGSIHAM